MARHRTISDEKIIEAARTLFEEKGHTVSTRDVAKLAGISQAVLYQRFKTKDDLFFAAMRPPLPDVNDILGSLPANPQEVENYLYGVADRLFRYFETAAPAFLHMITHPAFSPSAMLKAHNSVFAHEIVSGIARQFEKMKELGLVGNFNSTAAAEAFIGCLHNKAVFHAIAEAKHVSREGMNEMIAILWRGLRP